jgi:hypothetical protein
MSLRLRFRFEGKCSIHPRYDPERDGQPHHGDCLACDSLYVIHLYVRIAKRRAETTDGLIVRGPIQREEGAEPGPDAGSLNSATPEV